MNTKRRHNVFIKETLQNDYSKIEEIKISQPLFEALIKEPICGRSDYSDLPGAVVSHGSGCRSGLDTSRSSSSDPRKREEAQLRQKAIREEITRRREEKRLKQKARQHERRRQEEIMKTFQENYIMPSTDSGLIISSSPMKGSPAKSRDNKDAYLYEKFKKNLSNEFNSSSKKREGKLNRVASGETLEKEKEKTPDSSSCEMNEENDSAVTSSTQPFVTQKTAAASDRPQVSKAKTKVGRAVPEIVDADSSTPHIGRSTRKKQRICYEESPDRDTEEEEYFFQSSIAIEKEQTGKKKGRARQALKKTQKSLLNNTSLQKNNNEQHPKVSSDNTIANVSQECPRQVPDFEKNDNMSPNASPNRGRPFIDRFVINLDASDPSERPFLAAKFPHHSVNSSSFLLGNFPHHHILNNRNGSSPPSSNCESNLTLSPAHAHSHGIADLLMEKQKSNNLTSQCAQVSPVQSTLNYGHNIDRSMQGFCIQGNTLQSTHISPVSKVTHMYQTPTKPNQPYLPASNSMLSPSLQSRLTEFPHSPLRKSQQICASQASNLESRLIHREDMGNTRPTTLDMESSLIYRDIDNNRPTTFEMENAGYNLIHRDMGHNRPATFDRQNAGSILNQRELSTKPLTIETESAGLRLIYGEENISRMGCLNSLNHGRNADTVKPCELENRHTKEVNILPQNLFLTSPILTQNGSFYLTSHLSPVNRLELLNKSQTYCTSPNHTGLSTHQQQLLAKVPASVSQPSPKRYNDSLRTFPGVKSLSNPQVSDAINGIPTSSYLQNEPRPNNNLLCAVPISSYLQNEPRPNNNLLCAVPISSYLQNEPRPNNNLVFAATSSPSVQDYNEVMPRHTDYQQPHTSLTGQNTPSKLLSPKSPRVEKAVAQSNSKPPRSLFNAFSQLACNSMNTSQSPRSSAELFHTKHPHYTMAPQDSGARISSTTSDSHAKEKEKSCSIIKALLNNNASPSAATLLEKRKGNVQPDKRHFQNELQRKEGCPSSCDFKSGPNKIKASNDLTLKSVSRSDGNRIEKSSASNNEPHSEKTIDDVHYSKIPSIQFVSEPCSSAGSRELQSRQISNVMQSDNINSHTSSADKALNVSLKNFTKQTNSAVSFGSIGAQLSQVKQENPMDSLGLEKQPETCQFQNPVSQYSNLHMPPEVKCLPALLHLQTGSSNQNSCDVPVQGGEHSLSVSNRSSVFHKDHRLPVNTSRPSWPEDKSLAPSCPGSLATGSRALNSGSLNVTQSGRFSQGEHLIPQSSLPTSSIAESITVQETNSEESQCLSMPVISKLPQCIRSDVKPCMSQVAVVIAHLPGDSPLKCPQPGSHVQDRTGHYTVTASLPCADQSNSAEVEPDPSIVKSEDGPDTVSLHLKEVIDLSADNEDILLPREQADNIVHKDHCDKVTYIQSDESNRQNVRSETESPNSLCKVDENSTIFSDILKHASPKEHPQTSSHFPVNPAPVPPQPPSESAKSPTDIQIASPHLTSSKTQRVIAKIKSWTNSEVHDWLKSHHMDKICPNLIGLDGDGLQRMALQYMHDSDSFYTSVKRRLGLSVFQTLVICRSMKELTDI